MRRTFLSLVVGFVAGVLLAVAGSAGLLLIRPDLDGGVGNPSSLPAAEWIILELLVIFLSGVAGGYLTAAVARSSGVRHAAMLGALVVVAGTIALIIDTPAAPLLWYQLGMIGVVLPAVRMGGALRVERTGRSGTLGRAEPRTA